MIHDGPVNARSCPACHGGTPSAGWLKPGEVANLFRVDVKTVVRWAKEGRFPQGAVIFTPGGHRLFRRADVLAFFDPAGRPQEPHTYPVRQAAQRAEGNR